MAAKKKHGKNRFAIEGELTIYVAADLKEKIAGLFARDDNSENVEMRGNVENSRDAEISGAAIDIDLSQVSEMDTAGLQLLLLAQREAGRQNKTILFSNPSEAVLDCWRLCNVSHLFGADSAAAQ